MAVINVNLNAVEERKAHAEGSILVRVADAEIRTTKDGSSSYINWRLEPIGDENKSPLWLMTSLKPEALWNLKRFLHECGFAWETDGSFDTQDVLGSEVFVTNTPEEYEGTVRDRPGPPYKSAA